MHESRSPPELFNFLLAPRKHIYGIELFNPTPPLDFPNETVPNGHFNIYILIIYSVNKKSSFVGFARLCVLEPFLPEWLYMRKIFFRQCSNCNTKMRPQHFFFQPSLVPWSLNRKKLSDRSSREKDFHSEAFGPPCTDLIIMHIRTIHIKESSSQCVLFNGTWPRWNTSEQGLIQKNQTIYISGKQ